MNSNQPDFRDTTAVRQELAHVVRRLRAIRRARLSTDEALYRVNQTLAEAGCLARFLTFSPTASHGTSSNWQVRINHDELADAGYANRPRPRAVPVARAIA